jgi:hypothetical protein
LDAVLYRRRGSSTNRLLDRFSVEMFAEDLVRLYFCVFCVEQSTTAGFLTCLARLRVYVRGWQRCARTPLVFDAVFSLYSDPRTKVMRSRACTICGSEHDNLYDLEYKSLLDYDGSSLEGDFHRFAETLDVNLNHNNLTSRTMSCRPT